MNLVDTSAIARFANPAIQDALLRRDSLARCSMTDLEFRSSARNASEWASLSRVLSQFVAVRVEADDFDLAAEIQHSLAATSQRGRKVPDLVIAACAIRNQLPLLHYDRDFELIAGVSALRHEWIAPPGSID